MNLIEKIVKPGTRIELIPDDQPKDAVPGAVVRYQSQVSDIREDGKIEIYMPIEQGKLILLPVESRLDVYYYAASGIYECRAIIKERYKRDGLYFLALWLTSEVKKRQRREYYRYSCNLPLMVRKMDEVERKWMTERGKLIIFEDLPMDENTAVDISGGGMQFIGNNKYEVGDLLYGQFIFGKEYSQCLKILDSSVLPDRPGEYRHRAKFLGMDRRAREEIIQNIFSLERMKRKFEYNLE